MTVDLTAEERTALENAQLLVVSDTSKRGVGIGFLAHRALAASREPVEAGEPSEARSRELEDALRKIALAAEEMTTNWPGPEGQIFELIARNARAALCGGDSE
jgi:hypothetical protein